MKQFLILILTLVGTYADQYCYKKVVQDCASNTPRISCNADYGNFACVESLFNDLFKNYLMRSNEYLLIKTNFDNYEFARDGFANLFGQLSDHKWKTAIRLMRYITSRDGDVEFGCGNAYTNGRYTLYELEALALSADIEKEFTIDTNAIHKVVTSNIHEHDLSVAGYLEHKFSFQQMGVTRQIIGYVTELSRMSDKINYAVALEEFNSFLNGESV